MVQLRETLSRYGLEREQREKIGYFSYTHGNTLSQPIYVISPTGFALYCPANEKIAQHRVEAEVLYLSGVSPETPGNTYVHWLYGRTNVGEVLCQSKMQFLLQLFPDDIVPILVPSSLDQSTESKKGFDVLLCHPEGTLKKTPVYTPVCGIDCTYKGPGAVRRKRTIRPPIDPDIGVPVLVLPLYGAQKPWKKGNPPVTQVDRGSARIRMNDQIRHCILNGGSGTIIPFYGLTAAETAVWAHMYVEQLSIAAEETRSGLTGGTDQQPSTQRYPYLGLIQERLERVSEMIKEIKKVV